MPSVTVVHPRGETMRDVSDVGALNAYVINRGWSVQSGTYASAYQALTGQVYGPGSAGAASDSGMGLVNPSGLDRWQAALSDSVRGLANLTVWSHSIAFGVGSDGSGSASATPGAVPGYRTDGYVGQLRSLFTARYGDPGEGSLVVKPDSGIVTLGAGATVHATTGPFGSSAALDPTETATFAFTGTGLDVVWWDGGARVPQITVDGTVVFAGANAGNDFAGHAYKTTSVSGLTDAAHTAVLTNVGASGVAYVARVVARRAATGVRVHRVAEAGASTRIALNGYSSNLTAAQQDRILYSALTAPSPDLCIMGFLVNDQGAQVPVAESTATYQRAIDVVTGNGGCVLLISDPPVAAPAGALSEQAYRDAMSALANSNAHVAYLNMGGLFGTHARGDSLGLFPATGTVHPSRKGHGLMARALFDVLTVPRAASARPVTA